MVEYICPKCGNRTMGKKDKEPKNYILVCRNCGFEHRTLPKDESKKGFA